MKLLIIIAFFSLFLTGCSWISDLPRSIWGSSTRVLSEKREAALSREFNCSPQGCFDAVVDMTASYKEDSEDDDLKLMLFLKNKHRGHLVLMGVPGSVDTTEVGVFLGDHGGGRTRVEISSLSSRARDTAAKMIFDHLSNQFSDKSGED